jgi:hypothetical protein
MQRPFFRFCKELVEPKRKLEACSFLSMMFILIFISEAALD